MTTRIQKALDQRDQGFTLVELLVVIIIIGILAAIAIPTFLNQRKKAADASMKNDLKNIATVVETWMVDHPQAPITQAVIDATDAGGWGVAGTPLEGAKASPRNRIALHPNSNHVGAYCLTVFNANASKAVDGDHRIKYDSYNGGLQPGIHSWDCD